MKKQYFTIILSLMLVSIVWAGTVPPDSTIFPGLKGQQLMDSLYKYYRASSNLGYDLARDKMYGEIDILGDSLVCVYGGFTMYGGPTTDPTAWAYDGGAGINCEHTWPQSSFDEAALPRGDMHHLFPTEIRVNGDRGTLPFGDITDAQTTEWYRNKVILTSIPSSVINEYSERQVNVKFETREKQKGNTARAVFYFYNIYRPDYSVIETWWSGQMPYINDLLQWHIADQADAVEISRTRKIAAYQQGKKNPYVLDSTLVRRAYFPALGVAGEADNRGLIGDIRVYPNQPNPFSISTNIRFSLSAGAVAEFDIYDVSGRRVYSWKKTLDAGEHTVNWNGRNGRGEVVPNGVYMFRFQANGKPFATGRMVLVK